MQMMTTYTSIAHKSNRPSPSLCVVGKAKQRLAICEINMQMGTTQRLIPDSGLENGTEYTNKCLISFIVQGTEAEGYWLLIDFKGDQLLEPGVCTETTSFRISHDSRDINTVP